MKPTLVILAAGMGSRYGGIKQMDAFGPSGETIIDYSIYDAIRCGFGKIVFIIRKDFADIFRELFEKKLKGKIQTEYVMQEMDSFTDGFKPPAERTKPWGTAHAVLCSKDAVHEPFAVINADDFYGRDAFEKAVRFLQGGVSAKVWSIIGYELSKTLSANGTVSRGVCEADKDHNLIGIVERVKIYSEDNTIVYEENNVQTELPANTPVSMNFWCFHPDAYAYIEKLFKKFLREKGDNPKAEFFIPIVGDAFIKEMNGTIKVIETSAQWFGVTYKEDAPGVKASIRTLIQNGEYPATLWS
ncbi:MAG TPA: sugar phosphate nucleotidyltransferase [Chitinophagaceae bacterium]|nr:sugar phosphate nucleotidyltransferase [Chitinophagaceae bacterium]